MNIKFGLTAILFACLAFNGCGGGAGSSGSGGSRNGNGVGGFTDRGPADPVPWDIDESQKLIKYTGGSGQVRLEGSENDSSLYYMILENNENNQNNPYTSYDAFKIRTVVRDIQEHIQDNGTKRYEGEVQQGLGGYHKQNYESTDLGNYKFVYASVEPSLGIVQFQNGDLFTVGSEFSDSLPLNGTYIYSGVSTVGRYDSRLIDGLKVGSFLMIANFTEESAKVTGLVENGLALNGNVVINMVRGTFEGNELNWHLNFDNQNSFGTATINGSFHGPNGTGVSGIYSDNETDGNNYPRIYGAVVGKRQ